jgi:hypothetical protein
MRQPDARLLAILTSLENRGYVPNEAEQVVAGVENQRIKAGSLF